jgi:hypothetical protein
MKTDNSKAGISRSGLRDNLTKSYYKYNIRMKATDFVRMILDLSDLAQHRWFSQVIKV